MSAPEERLLRQPPAWHRAAAIFVLGALGMLALSPLMAQEPATLLTNERHPAPGLVTGGAPTTPAGFEALAKAGYRTFVDLRSDAEISPETRAAAEAAGLRYQRIPIAGDQDLNLGTARALDALLDERAAYPVAVVCASGNRVGALLAVRTFWLDGTAAEEALALGRQAGLTRLEPAVRSLLGLPAAPAAEPRKP
jgi:protein tyrosine phosphatase (PTP) superfamily phosphohydrolase (DUF442 family)